MSPDDGMGGAADDRMIYTKGAGIGRVLLFIGGLGMLFSPVTLLVQHSTDNAPEWSSYCETVADTMPDQDLAAAGCPADPR